MREAPTRRRHVGRPTAGDDDSGLCRVAAVDKVVEDDQLGEADAVVQHDVVGAVGRVEAKNAAREGDGRRWSLLSEMVLMSYAKEKHAVVGVVSTCFNTYCREHAKPTSCCNGLGSIPSCCTPIGRAAAAAATTESGVVLGLILEALGPWGLRRRSWWLPSARMSGGT